MTPGAILDALKAKGVRLTRDGGDLIATPRAALTDDLRALIRAHKVELLQAVERSSRPSSKDTEGRRQRALAMLAGTRGRYAVVTDTETEPEAVILALAIRDIGTCELRIPRARFDPFLLLELVERHRTLH